MKTDYHPLLGPGGHRLTMTALRDLTTTIGDAPHREWLFGHLQSLYNGIYERGIRADLWVDGSFLTIKPKPSDIDGCIAIHSDEYDRLNTEALDYLDSFNEPDYFEHPILDMFTHIIYNREDPKFVIEERSWEWQWSKQHDEKYLKGYVIVAVGSAAYEPF